MSVSKISLSILIAVLFFGNLFFAYQYIVAQRELTKATQALDGEKFNEGVVAFALQFIEKVLKAKKEIDFETRLTLENNVRNLRDQEIVSQWRKFVNSESEAEAQEEVKNLLELLIRRIKLK